MKFDISKVRSYEKEFFQDTQKNKVYKFKIIFLGLFALINQNAHNA